MTVEPAETCLDPRDKPEEDVAQGTDVLYSIGNFVQICSWWLASYLAGWLSLAATLHSVARRTPKGLKL